jgi:hypothetical protein
MAFDLFNDLEAGLPLAAIHALLSKNREGNPNGQCNFKFRQAKAHHLRVSPCRPRFARLRGGRRPTNP